jgi:hypothetical protein
MWRNVLLKPGGVALFVRGTAHLLDHCTEELSFVVALFGEGSAAFLLECGAEDIRFLS